MWINRFLRAQAARVAQSARELRTVRCLTTTALLLALNIVLHFYFTIRISDVLQVSVSFLPIAATSALFGPVVGGVAAAAGDVLKFFVRPTGSFHIGFTLNALINGVIYGLVLYKRPVRLWRAALAKALTSIVVNLTLTPFWLMFLYGDSFFVLLNARLLKNALLWPIESFLLYMMLGVLQRIKPIRAAERGKRRVI